MADITVYHNPKCSKSRGALEILQSGNLDIEVIEYIDNPPSEATLKFLVDKLGADPVEMFHAGSFEKFGGNYADYDTAEAIIGLLKEHPEVMNRPICVRGDRVVVARPSDKVNEILD